VSDYEQSTIQGVLIDEHLRLTLIELGRACDADTQHLIDLVDEGILTPRGDDPSTVYFDGQALLRARKALRLQRDLELETAATALVLELLDELERLRELLRRSDHLAR